MGPVAPPFFSSTFGFTLSDERQEQMSMSFTDICLNLNLFWLLSSFFVSSLFVDFLL